MSFKITHELDENPFEVQEPPAPVPGNVVFGPRDDDWELNAYLNYEHSTWHWDWYADGYKTAGDLLVQFAAASPSRPDALVFPVAFNYRQYLELRLKELLILGSRYLGRKFSLPKHHDLMTLWGELRPMLLAMSPGGDVPLSGVEHVIKEFNRIDVGSISFRYPVEKDGLTPSLAGVTRINLGQLRDRIAEVAWVLDGFSAGINEYLNQGSGYDA